MLKFVNVDLVYFLVILMFGCINIKLEKKWRGRLCFCWILWEKHEKWDKRKESGDKVCVLFHFLCGVIYKEPQFCLTQPFFWLQIFYTVKSVKCLPKYSTLISNPSSLYQIFYCTYISNHVKDSWMISNSFSNQWIRNKWKKKK